MKCFKFYVFYDDRYTAWPVVITFRENQLLSRSLALTLFSFFGINVREIEGNKMTKSEEAVIMKDGQTNDSGR